MKELNIEKLKLARAARIKVRENIQEAFSAVEQLYKSLDKFRNRYHTELDEINDSVTNIVRNLDFENGRNNEIISWIDFYLEHKYCSDDEMALLEKEVNKIQPC